MVEDMAVEEEELDMHLVTDMVCMNYLWQVAASNISQTILQTTVKLIYL